MWQIGPVKHARSLGPVWLQLMFLKLMFKHQRLGKKQYIRGVTEPVVWFMSQFHTHKSSSQKLWKTWNTFKVPQNCRNIVPRQAHVINTFKNQPKTGVSSMCMHGFFNLWHRFLIVVHSMLSSLVPIQKNHFAICSPNSNLPWIM